MFSYEDAQTHGHTDEATIQLAIFGLARQIQMAPDQLEDGRTLDKEGLTRDMATLVAASAQYNHTDLLMLVAGLVSHLHPAAYVANPTEHVARGMTRAGAASLALKRGLTGAGRLELVDALSRMQQAQLAVAETCAGGRAVLGMSRAVAMQDDGEVPGDAGLIPLEGWYVVDADGLRWRYCDGQTWTDQFRPV
jgi:hypothetical protein